MFGGVIFGTLSDRVGRKPIMVICSLTQALLGLSLHWVQNFTLFILLRVCQGIFIQGLQTSSYILILELFPGRSHLRTYAGAAAEFFWALGVMGLGGIAYYIQHWRYIQLALSLPSVVTITYIW